MTHKLTKPNPKRKSHRKRSKMLKDFEKEVKEKEQQKEIQDGKK